MLKAGLGLIALAGVALATPAFAQTIHLGGGSSGVSVGVGERGYDRGYRGDYDRPRRGYGVRIHDDSYAAARCKTTKIYRNGSVKTIRRCS